MHATQQYYENTILELETKLAAQRLLIHSLMHQLKVMGWVFPE